MVMPEVHGQRVDKEGPPTYRDPSFSEIIASAAGLEPTGPALRVVDIMSRRGKMAAELRTLAPQHSYTAIALTHEQLAGTPEGISTLTADARSFRSIATGMFDVGVARYGFKDFNADDQPVALASAHGIINDNGVLAVADMVAPTGTKDWLNGHHRHKQRLEGRNIERDGECHIPTREEWLDLLTAAGFRPDVVGYYTSRVTTTDWVKGLQFGKDMEEANAKREEMDHEILDAPPGIARFFNIREEEGLVKIDYPVIIIRAVKPVDLIDNE